MKDFARLIGLEPTDYKEQEPGTVSLSYRVPPLTDRRAWTVTGVDFDTARDRLCDLLQADHGSPEAHAEAARRFPGCRVTCRPHPGGGYCSEVRRKGRFVQRAGGVTADEALAALPFDLHELARSIGLEPTDCRDVDNGDDRWTVAFCYRVPPDLSTPCVVYGHGVGLHQARQLAARQLRHLHGSPDAHAAVRALLLEGGRVVCAPNGELFTAKAAGRRQTRDTADGALEALAEALRPPVELLHTEGARVTLKDGVVTVVDADGDCVEFTDANTLRLIALALNNAAGRLS